MIFTYRNQKVIEEGGEKIKSFATFYYEFKCDRGFFSMMFYPLFFLRRYCYILGLYFLEDYPLIQVISNSSLSVLTLVHLIVFKPFIDKANNVLNIISEVILSVMFILSGCFLLDLSDDLEQYLGKSLIILAGSVVLIVIGSLVFKLIRSIRNCRKKRYNEVVPELHNQTEVQSEYPRFRSSKMDGSIFHKRGFEVRRKSVKK